MVAQIELGDIAVEVVKKDIRNLHLSVYPPHGAVRISAPLRMKLDTIRVFAISKLDWIKQQQTKLRAQDRETTREYLDRESHYLWGKRYLLKVLEADAAPSVEIKHRRLILRVRSTTDYEAKQAAMAQWYRREIKAVLPDVLEKWTTPLGVAAPRVFIQKMKTRWGSCNPETHAIRLNTDLARKPKECLEFVVLHELVHFVERRHNDRFTRLMDQHMPDWRHRREVLNAAPLAHQHWSY